jgi:putative acetyltransferase
MKRKIVLNNSMPKTVRTNSSNKDFADLVHQLNQYLAIKDGELHSFYNQYNSIELLQHVILIYEDNIPVGCGAIKPLTNDNTSMEIKRMFVLPEYRRLGNAGLILQELEDWTSDLGYQKCVLETGKNQTEAMALYHSKGYKIVQNYGPYIGVENSICFEKQLTR